MSQQNTELSRQFVEEPELVRFQMWAPDPNAEGERANLKFVFRGPNPGIVVWLRGPNEKGKPPVRAAFNSMNFGFFIDALRTIADAAPGTKPADMATKNSRRLPDGGKEDFVQSYVRVARNEDGLVCVGVFDAQDDTRSRILFPLVVDRWTGVIKRNGEALDLPEISSMIAKQLAGILEHEYHKRMLWQTREEQQAQQAQFEANRNQGTRGKSGGGGNYQKKSNNFGDFSDDVI